MDIKEKNRDGICVLEPIGRLDATTAPELDQKIEAIDMDGSPCHLLIDFCNIEYISSAGLRIILKAVKKWKVTAKDFAISNTHDYVREIFEISGFESFIVIYSSNDEAIASFA